MKKILLILIMLLALAGGVAGYAYYQLFRKPVVAETAWIYIRGDQVVTDSVGKQPQLTALPEGREMSLACQLNQFDQKLASGSLEGAYRLKEGMSAMDVARKLTRRQQDPVRLTFTGVRLKEQLAGRLARPLMCDSLSVLEAMTAPEFLAEAGLDEANIGIVFLPDTYEVFWNITPAKLMERMFSEYRHFWNEERRLQAEALHLTPREVCILASIAEEETTGRQERGTVARLYWNRLQQGMLLQADPTVKFALGDFGLRRILLAHLTVDSPYNTYRYAGLPPGPIRIVEKATIDTILQSQPNDYLYMCARPDFSGRHNFATTLTEHNRNAAAYHAALAGRN